MKNFILLLVLYVLVSCNSNKDYIYEYYENGNIKSKREYKVNSLDTLFDGLSIFYSKDNFKEAEIMFSNNLKEGLELQYFRNGKIKAKLENVNNKTNGYGLWYYESGELLDSSFYINSKVIGDRKMFYKSGKLKKYLSHSVIDSGAVNLVWTYSESGELIERSEDSLLIEVHANKILFRVGEVMNIDFYLPFPPNSKTFFSCAIYKEGIDPKRLKIINYKEYKSDPINLNYCFQDTGSYVVVPYYNIILGGKSITQNYLQFVVTATPKTHPHLSPNGNEDAKGNKAKP